MHVRVQETLPACLGFCPQVCLRVHVWRLEWASVHVCDVRESALTPNSPPLGINPLVADRSRLLARIWTHGSFPAMSPGSWLILSLPHPWSSWHTPGAGTCFKVLTGKGLALGQQAGHPRPTWTWVGGSGAQGFSTPGLRHPVGNLPRGCWLGSEPGAGQPHLCPLERAAEGGAYGSRREI